MNQQWIELIENLTKLTSTARRTRQRPDWPVFAPLLAEGLRLLTDEAKTLSDAALEAEQWDVVEADVRAFEQSHV